jgi:glycosyltransferase involved in cell wall biosynthesis
MHKPIAMTTAPARPRILHLLRLDAWAGTQRQIASQVLRSDPAVSEQRIVIMSPPGPLYEWLRRQGVDVQSLAGRLGFFGVLLRLMRTLKRHPVDAIEAYGFRAAMVARMAALIVGRPAIIVGVRGMHLSEAEDVHGWKSRLGIAVERALAWSVWCYDANSKGARDFLVLRGIPAEKFVVIPNGVDTDSYPRARKHSHDVLRAVCVARFIPRKRHDVLLDALSRVRDAGVHINCDLIGYGPMENRISGLVRGLDLDDRVTVLTGLNHSGVSRRLAGADVFVLTSLWEGMPGSVLEAMAVGLPVVATNVNGTREVVQDGVTGLLVPRDDADAAARAVLRLARDAKLRRGMGAAGRARVQQKFSVDRMVAEKEALYTRLVVASEPTYPQG